MFGFAKLAALFKLDQQDKALEYAEKLSKTHIGDQAQGLNGLAWAIVDPSRKIELGKKAIQFALDVARRADEKANGKDAAIADTLGRAYFVAGEISQALETQERAVQLAKGTPFERDPSIKNRLEEYKKAAAK